MCQRTKRWVTSLTKRTSRKHISAAAFSSRFRWSRRWWVGLLRCRSNSSRITEWLSNLFLKYSNYKVPRKIWVTLTSNKLCRWWTVEKLNSPNQKHQSQSHRLSILQTSDLETRLRCWTRWLGLLPPSKVSKKTQSLNNWPSSTRKLQTTAVFYSEINKKSPFYRV